MYFGRLLVRYLILGGTSSTLFNSRLKLCHWGNWIPTAFVDDTQAGKKYFMPAVSLLNSYIFEEFYEYPLPPDPNTPTPAKPSKYRWIEWPLHDDFRFRVSRVDGQVVEPPVLVPGQKVKELFLHCHWRSDKTGNLFFCPKMLFIHLILIWPPKCLTLGPA